MIRIFDKTATDFTTQGLGVLLDATECKVTEEINGAYELTMSYPVNGQHYSDIQVNNIIVTEPNTYDSPQAFRIYEISKPIDGIIEVNAQHLSYDLSDYIYDPIIDSSGEVLAFENIGEALAAAQYSIISTDKTSDGIPFTISSDMTVSTEKTTQLTVDKPCSVRSLLMADSNSIRKIYGGEFIFDNYNIDLVETRGTDRGFTVEYSKNMSEMTQTTSDDTYYTCVFPFYHTTTTKTVSETTNIYQQMYIVNSSKALQDGWLSTEEGGEPLDTSEISTSTAIQIATEGDYYEKLYVWSGKNKVYMGGTLPEYLGVSFANLYRKVKSTEEGEEAWELITDISGTAKSLTDDSNELYEMPSFSTLLGQAGVDGYEDTSNYIFGFDDGTGTVSTSTLNTILTKMAESDKFKAVKSLIESAGSKITSPISVGMLSMTDTSNIFDNLFNQIGGNSLTTTITIAAGDIFAAAKFKTETQYNIVVGSDSFKPDISSIVVKTYNDDQIVETFDLTSGTYSFKTGPSEFNKFLITFKKTSRNTLWDFKTVALDMYYYYGDARWNEVKETDYPANLQSTESVSKSYPTYVTLQTSKDINVNDYSDYIGRDTAHHYFYYTFDLGTTTEEVTEETTDETDTTEETTKEIPISMKDKVITIEGINLYQAEEEESTSSTVEGTTIKSIITDMKTKIASIAKNKVTTELRNGKYYDHVSYYFLDKIATYTPSTDRVETTDEESGETTVTYNSNFYVEVIDETTTIWYRVDEDRPWQDITSVTNVEAQAVSTDDSTFSENSSVDYFKSIFVMYELDTPQRYELYFVKNNGNSYETEGDITDADGKSFWQYDSNIFTVPVDCDKIRVHWYKSDAINAFEAPSELAIKYRDPSAPKYYIIPGHEDDGYERMMYLDLTSEFDEAPTAEDLLTEAKEYISENKIGEIKETIEVSFIDIYDTPAMAKYKDLEKVEIGDVVKVRHIDLGVDSTLRVISYEYDVLSSKYETVTLGTDDDALSNSAVTKGDSVSALTNDVDYADKTTVKNLVASTISAQTISASTLNAKEGIIDKLKAGYVDISGTLKTNALELDKLIANMLTADNAQINEQLTAGNIVVNGILTAQNGSTIGDCEVVSAYRNKVKTDENGLTIYETDENGEEILDIYGDPIPVYVQATETDSNGNEVLVYETDEDGNKVPVYEQEEYSMLQVPAANIQGNIDIETINIGNVSYDEAGNESGSGFAVDKNGNMYCTDATIRGVLKGNSEVSLVNTGTSALNGTTVYSIANNKKYVSSLEGTTKWIILNSVIENIDFNKQSLGTMYYYYLSSIGTYEVVSDPKNYSGTMFIEYPKSSRKYIQTPYIGDTQYDYSDTGYLYVRVSCYEHPQQWADNGVSVRSGVTDSNNGVYQWSNLSFPINHIVEDSERRISYNSDDFTSYNIYHNNLDLNTYNCIGGLEIPLYGLGKETGVTESYICITIPSYAEYDDEQREIETDARVRSIYDFSYLEDDSTREFTDRCWLTLDGVVDDTTGELIERSNRLDLNTDSVLLRFSFKKGEHGKYYDSLTETFTSCAIYDRAHDADIYRDDIINDTSHVYIDLYLKYLVRSEESDYFVNSINIAVIPYDESTIVTTEGYDINGTYYDSSLAPASNNKYSLGNEKFQYAVGYIKELYGKIADDSSSDRRLKNDISYENMDKYESLIYDMKPATYRYKSDKNNRLHMGFIAQDVEEIIHENNLTDDLAIFNNRHQYYALGYSELHALEVYEIQKLRKEIDILKQELKDIKEHK